MQPAQPVRYGWFSEASAQAHGFATYRSLDSGRIVNVTFVTDTPELPNNYGWPDVVPAGPLGEFVKSCV